MEGDLATSLFRNGSIPAAWRYGIPLFLIGAFSLLLASDLGSGVSAEKIILRSDGTVFDRGVLLTASIFSSVKELWDTGSYPLAILIVITSIMWPYLKLCLSMFGWVVPPRNLKRRERLLEIVDALGKWSFVDIFVLLVIIVAFRSSIPATGGSSLEIIIIPKWGFFGFVLASIMSLVATHIILYFHRKVQFKQVSTSEQSTQVISVARQSNISPLLVAGLLIGSVSLHLAGCIVDVFEVTSTNTKGTIYDTQKFSLVAVGSKVPISTLEPDDVGIRWIQAMYFFLAVAMPIFSASLFSILFICPMTSERQKALFQIVEISFSWAAMEVLVLCTLVSILEIPTFSSGLIESGCPQCYVVESSTLPLFGVSVAGAVVQVIVSIWLYRRAHAAVYPTHPSSPEDTDEGVEET